MKQEWFVLMLGGERYGLPLSQVDEVVRAARLVRIPQAPPALAGALMLRGESVPVLDLRARFGVPPARLEPRQLFVIGSVGRRRAALVVDTVEGLVPLEMDNTPDDAVARPLYVTGLGSDPSGASILILDLEHVLSTREASEVADAMKHVQEAAAQFT